jgi:opacity protein-like surface antigen
MLVGLPGVAAAEPNDSWYVSAGIGANWLDDVSGTIVGTAGGTTADFVAEFDTGWVVDGAVGYNWDAFRLELELGYRSNDAGQVFADPPPPGPGLSAQPGVGGDVSAFSQMLNLIFDIPLGDAAELSLGGGLGGAFIDVDIGGVTTGGSTLILTDDDYVFAYQALAGLSIDVGDHTEIFGEYRYFKADKVDVNGEIVGATLVSANELDFENHSALIGIRFYFGEEPEVIEETPPPPPAAITNFTIYFNKKGALSSEAHATLQEAADVHKGGAPTVTIEAQGGGPRAGDAVTRALVDLGVAEEKIAVQTHDNGDATITITQ